VNISRCWDEASGYPLKAILRLINSVITRRYSNRAQRQVLFGFNGSRRPDSEFLSLLRDFQALLSGAQGAPGDVELGAA
jgi:hypothetical protein